MKWHNIDCGPGCYYITSTFTDWLKLFNDRNVLRIVQEEITRAASECEAGILAHVFTPDHLHLVIQLPGMGILHRFCKLWRGRSSRGITAYLSDRGTQQTTGFGIEMPKHSSSATAPAKAQDILARMAAHASGTAQYTVWKEQPRALFLWDEQMLRQKIDYTHANPVRRGLVQHPGDWPFSSWRFYEGDGESLLPIAPWPM